MKALPASLAALLLLPCCQRNGPLTHEPDASEITGRYELSMTAFDETIDRTIMNRMPKPSIELFKDGKAVLSGLPIVLDKEDGSFELSEFRGGEGKYEITALGEIERQADVKLYYGLYLNCGDLPDPACSPRLRKEKGNYVLAYDYYHGSFVQRMAFRKVEAK